MNVLPIKVTIAINKSLTAPTRDSCAAAVISAATSLHTLLAVSDYDQADGTVFASTAILKSSKLQ